MAEDRKYFIFNKPMDYRRGTVDRMNAADGILRLTGAEPGWFFSRVLDSREEEMTWHRLRTVCAERDGGWNMTLYSSDSRFLVWGDNSAPVDEVLADPELSLEEKKRRMSSCFAKEIRGEADVLLLRPGARREILTGSQRSGSIFRNRAGSPGCRRSIREVERTGIFWSGISVYSRASMKS